MLLTRNRFITDQDTPSSYSGQASRFPRVNSAEDALEFITATFGSDISVRCTHSVSQSIPNGVFTNLQFDGETFDTDDMHDNVTNNERITINTAGKYVLAATASMAENATGNRAMTLRLNDSTLIAVNTYPVSGSGFSMNMIVAIIYDLVVGDFVTAQVAQFSGGALNSVVANDYAPRFAAIKVLG